MNNKFNESLEASFNEIFSEEYIPSAGDICEMLVPGGKWVKINVEAYSNSNQKISGFIKGERFLSLTKDVQFRRIGE